MIFYTYYPYPHRDYPYLLRNINQKVIPYKHQIVDCGIYDLLKKGEYTDKKISKWKNLILNDGSWKTVPDYPDLNKEFKGKFLKSDNIELSKQLALELFNPNDKSHLISIQGHYSDVLSFERYAKWIIKEFGYLNKLAIGTVCKLSNKETAMKTFKTIRGIFPKAKLHAFGLRYDYIKEASKFIDSYDSMSWTFPRKSSGKGSCKNLKERLENFDDWLKYLPGNQSTKQKILMEY